MSAPAHPPPLWNVSSVLRWTSQKFQKLGIDAPRLSAELLLAHVLQCSRIALYLEYERPLEPEELRAYRSLIQRRCKGEPTQYLIGSKEFYSRPFLVDSRALIPRFETELLVDFALEKLPKGQKHRVADVGTGCGCIALSLALERPETDIWATDICPRALSLAQENAHHLGSPPNLHWCEGHLLSPLAPCAPLDMVVSNPPYLCAQELQNLQREVGFEPMLALDGGDDGMQLLSKLILQAPLFLAPKGWLLLEIGEHQAEKITQQLLLAGYSEVAIYKDWAGFHRIAQAQFT
ncbi:MAG: peptide chain release factor N(5)-glutamine methyltransferase [Proteobacteria bacterium]|nr:peptide chain release factor N(5)-glutamine methyltransferase [Cystobacterineae bacterium]MCL2258842.1 peptide chain release factor N(5)-glutamine methyltransferase [Cystobacterineae bacterium]MCL2314776.1 peptide chain release factor N(5)-glutamine methyltransferase [Pseudomonadota bacterium]